MILPRSRAIDLGRLSSAFTSFVELSYVELGPGESLFDGVHRGEREQAVSAFAEYVYDRHDEELAYRDALAWTLNLPDDRFAELLPRLKVRFPHQRDPAEIRRFLELLWARTWGDWRVPGFDPDSYDCDA